MVAGCDQFGSLPRVRFFDKPHCLVDAIRPFERFANLYVKDGSRYTDHAFNRTYTGRDGMAKWFSNTKYFVQNAKIEVTSAFVSCDDVSISWTFSGHLANAPKPFSVPVLTALRMRGHEILTNDDFYNLRDVLLQSGLPTDTDFG